MTVKIPLTRPWMDDREAQAASRVILSGWVTQGPEVAAFEREFAVATGAEHAVAVSNCTTALHVALRAVGVQPGDEVITVSHSFIATANVVRYCGAIPVFIDIELATCNCDPSLIESAITEKTRAILCVHQMGMPCDLSTICAFAKRYNIPVVEDAACAIGSEILHEGRWERIGKPHGDVACFSFHPRKLISTGDGGMLTTSNPEYDKCFRLWRQHSMSISDAVRHGSSSVVFESYKTVGYNYRMTDIQAAVGREQLKRLPDIVVRRRALAGRYMTLLANIPGIALPCEPAWARSNWQSFWVRLTGEYDQQAVMQAMLDAGISTRRGIMCSHREPAYRTEPWRIGGSEGLAKSELAQDSCLILPLYHDMTEEDQDRVVRTLGGVLSAEHISALC